MNRQICPVILTFLLGLSTCETRAQKAPGPPPLPVKVVIVSLYETGLDQGDAPGEFQFWVEREKLNTVYPLPNAVHHVRANKDGVIGTVAGVGTARAAASIMALGSDARFDLTRAYWLVTGIAGIDPEDGSLGSAVWCDWVVDADLAHEIDAREIPSDWSTGYVPLHKRHPYENPPLNRGEAYALNSQLVAWAYNLTKNTALADSLPMAAYRSRYQGRPKAQQPPMVLRGTTLSGSTYWHGALLNRWANDWVSYWTEGKGNYMVTTMEDSGIMQSLSLLSKAKKVDLNRVLVLRTASDYDSPPTDLTAVESLKGNSNTLIAYRPALESAHKVGSQVVHALVAGWNKYRVEPPGLSPKH